MNLTIAVEDVTHYFELVVHIERLIVEGACIKNALREIIELCHSCGLRADGSQHEIFMRARDELSG